MKSDLEQQEIAWINSETAPWNRYKREHFQIFPSDVVKHECNSLNKGDDCAWFLGTVFEKHESV